MGSVGGSGSGHGQPSFLEDIHEFVTAATEAVSGEKIRIKKLSKRESDEHGDHSWDTTIGYSFRFRGLPVTIHTNETELNIDGVRVGRDVDSNLFGRLRYACADRVVFQSIDGKAVRKRSAAGREAAQRQKEYAPLVRRLRKAKASRRGIATKK